MLAVKCLSFCCTFSHASELFQIYVNNGHSLDTKETETVLACVNKRLKWNNKRKGSWTKLASGWFICILKVFFFFQTAYNLNYRTFIKKFYMPHFIGVEFRKE